MAFTERASALARVAQDRTDFDQMQQAMVDTIAAKRVMRLRDNTTALTHSLYVHHLAAILYQQNQKTRELEETLHIARADAQVLARFPNIPLAVWFRGVFLADNQQEQEALQCYEEGMKHKTMSSTVRIFYAWLLYERGEAKKAFQVLEQGVGIERDFSRAVFVAGLPEGLRRAREICDGMSEEPAYVALRMRSQTLFFLGQTEAALEVLRPYQPNTSYAIAEWHTKVVDYFNNPDAVTRKNLLEFASRTKGYPIRSHFALGVRQLAEGDRISARQHFQQCVALRDPYLFAYTESRAILARMKKDPTWPPWIPVKP
jgi:tetratricopeptide (TPR) repeat protein